MGRKKEEVGGRKGRDRVVSCVTLTSACPFLLICTAMQLVLASMLERFEPVQEMGVGRRGCQEAGTGGGP